MIFDLPGLQELFENGKEITLGKYMQRKPEILDADAKKHKKTEVVILGPRGLEFLFFRFGMPPGSILVSGWSRDLIWNLK